MSDKARQTRNAEVNFRGTKRSNGWHWNAIGPSDNGKHASVTDRDARPYKKTPGAAMLCFTG